MVVEVIDRLLTCRTGCYVDATLGGGGHARAILNAIWEGGKLIGIDKDAEAIAEVRTGFLPFGERVLTVHRDFRQISRILDHLGISSIDGILFDLGVSSHQINTPERGFSYRENGPLDMRMDQATDLTAADIVNKRSAEELSRLFRQYGEERFSRRVAFTIVAQRQVRPLATTGDLSSIITDVIPGRWPQKTAARVFQALRIAVNDELNALGDALHQAVSRLKPGGRIVVISYHSLEDRIVKEQFRSFASENVLRIIDKKPVTPSREEVERNPRARSAKLRTAQKVK
jgi:16S rRNA (cytosine1402-N4)-methyltransferase